MRYLVLMRISPEAAAPYENGVMSEDDDLEDMMAFNERLGESGMMLTGEGLAPTSHGAIVSFETGQGVVTDGPFTEVKDVIGGFWTIRADSREEIVTFFRDCPMDDGDALEIREIFEMADFEATIANQ